MEESSQSWTCPCFSLLPQILLEQAVTSFPLVWVLICQGNKGKITFNSQSPVDNRSLFFSLFDGDFFLLKEGLCSCPKVPAGFQGWKWTKNCSYCAEELFPLIVQKTAVLTKTTNAGSEQSTNWVSSIRRPRATAWGLHEQTHTCTHTLCLPFPLLSTQIIKKTCYQVAFLESISVLL